MSAIGISLPESGRSAFLSIPDIPLPPTCGHSRLWELCLWGRDRLMQKHAWARGITLTALVTAAVAASFLALGMRPDGIARYYHDTLTPAGFIVWSTGLIVATLSPPILAITFWFGSKMTRYDWLLHFLLVPVTCAVVRGAIAIMLIAASEQDSDGRTGWATDPASMLTLLCPAVYFATLGFTKLHRRSAPVNDS